MTNEGIIVSILAIVGFLFFGYLSYLLIFEPKKGEKFLDSTKVPGAFWTNSEGAGGMMIIMIFIFFFFFSCLLCSIIFGFVQSRF